MGVQADLPIQGLQQQHTTCDHCIVNLLAAQTGDLGAALLKPGLQGLITLFGNTARAAQQLDGVIFIDAFTNPVTGLTVIDLGKDLHQLTQQRT
ncbi:hypothetical protein D3C84_945180 [compost metagenome]